MPFQSRCSPGDCNHVAGQLGPEVPVQSVHQRANRGGRLSHVAQCLRIALLLEPERWALADRVLAPQPWPRRFGETWPAESCEVLDACNFSHESQYMRHSTTILVLDASVWPSRVSVQHAFTHAVPSCSHALHFRKQSAAPRRPSGPTLIDDAIDCAKNICCGSSSVILWVMLPQQHSAVERRVTIQNRRLLEDKCSGLLGALMPCLFHAAMRSAAAPGMHSKVLRSERGLSFVCGGRAWQ